MRRISANVVELTTKEDEANDRWNDLLDLGYGIYEATNEVAKEFPELDEDFLDYLRN